MESMDRAPIELITVSREYGAGGSEFGVLLGERLGWRVLDRDMASRIAKRMRCDARMVEAIAERGPTLLERVISAFTVVPAEAPIVPDPSAPLDPNNFVAASRVVLDEAVRELPLVIIGHGANCYFAGRPDVFRVRVAAPYDLRVRRIVQRTGQSYADAAEDVRRHDENRRVYLERYYNCGVHDPSAYDLQVNTGTIPLDTAADLVTAIVSTRKKG
jgi:Cytidylate kinase-like family